MVSRTTRLLLGLFFGLFVLFLYGPLISVFVLAFQGPEGGLTFPMRGFSTHWFGVLWEGVGVVDIWRAFRRSIALGTVVMIITVVLSLMAGLAFRQRFTGSGTLFYVAVASLIVPSIVVSLGIALEFRLIDDAVKAWGRENGAEWVRQYTTSMGLFTSAMGAQLTWTLPFGLLIMFAVFNRFDPSYEEAARDLGAGPWATFREAVLPLIAPALVGVALFGFTLSYDEIARTSQAIGGLNTLPLELRGLTTTVTNPSIYALGAVTTGISFLVIGLAVAASWWLRKRRAARLAKLGGTA